MSARQLAHLVVAVLVSASSGCVARNVSTVDTMTMDTQPDASPTVSLSGGVGGAEASAAAAVEYADAARTADGGERVGDEPVMFSSGTLDRVELTDAVLRRNPSLAAMRQAWRAAETRPSQVSALDDPMASFGLAPLSIVSSKVDFGARAEISQRFPWPGELNLKRESAQRQADARGHDYAAARLDFALAVVGLYDDYYLVGRALRINAEHVRLMADYQRVATERYAAGMMSQHEPIAAEVELAHLEHRRLELLTRQRVTAARINALLHRRPEAELPPPPPTLKPGRLMVAASELKTTELAGLQELALSSHPELAAATDHIDARRAELGLADLEGYPRFGVTASYNSMWRSEEHRWMAGLNLNLPVWRQRVRANRAEARASLLQAEAQRSALEDEIRSMVHETLQYVREAHHVLELFRSRLVPAARDQARAARAAVEANTGSFLELILAEKNAKDVELGYERALTEADRRTAELLRHLGRSPAGEDMAAQEFSMRQDPQPGVVGGSL